MLEDLGHDGRAASSGQEALNILRRDSSIALVITDQVMPQMTGVQLAEAIQHEWPDLPVILTTGYAEMMPGEGAGLARLAKPFTQAELAEQLTRVRPREHRVLKFRGGANSNGTQR
jgi:CheY-like chemotaxis protein